MVVLDLDGVGLCLRVESALVVDTVGDAVAESGVSQDLGVCKSAGGTVGPRWRGTAAEEERTLTVCVERTMVEGGAGAGRTEGVAIGVVDWWFVGVGWRCGGVVEGSWRRPGEGKFP